MFLFSIPTGNKDNFPDNVNKPLRLSAITAAVLTAINVNAVKADTNGDKPPSLELPSLEIIGQEPSQLESIPGSGFVIDKTTLDRQGPLSTKDAMRTVPGIHIVDEDVLGRRYILAFAAWTLGVPRVRNYWKTVRQSNWRLMAIPAIIIFRPINASTGSRF